MSFFITFEGIEGSGKSTQLQRLKTFFENRGDRVLVTREPGGCRVADIVRAILLNPDNGNLVPRAELLLYAAARAQHVEEVIRPNLAQGVTVLCDRFYDATTAYQGAGRGLDPILIDALNHLATDGLAPDLTLLFDFPVEDGLARARQRNRDADQEAEGRFELEELDFHQRVRYGYLALASQDRRFRIIDARGDLETVADRVSDAIDEFLARRSQP